jgi:uncharacterized protein YlxP (DUF503 family)
MIVGASVVELHIEGCHSLKAKRGVVRSIAQRVRNHFNLSVAEVGGQDTWQRAVLGSPPASTRSCAAARPGRGFIEELHLAEVRTVDVDVVDLPHQEGLWDPEDPEDPEAP